jgi:hypothetical protein
LDAECAHLKITMAILNHFERVFPSHINTHILSFSISPFAILRE